MPVKSSSRSPRQIGVQESHEQGPEPVYSTDPQHPGGRRDRDRMEATFTERHAVELHVSCSLRALNGLLDGESVRPSTT